MAAVIDKPLPGMSKPFLRMYRGCRGQPSANRLVAMPPQTIHLSTCVWGPWHLNILDRIMWPTALAPDNLPALARRFPLLYRICTTKADRPKIEAMPSFKAIAKLVPVEFDTELPGDAPEPIFHMHWYGVARRYAIEKDAVNLLLWPDIIFTDRTLGHVADALECGKAGGVLPTLRVVSETCVPDILSSFEVAPGQPMPIAPGDVVRLAVRHIHPLSAATLAHARHGKPGTSLLFRVPGEGLVARSAYTWLFVDPGRLEITDEGEVVGTMSNPEQFVHVVADSDDMLFLSLAPLRKELETLIPGHANDFLDIARMTQYAWLARSPFYDCYDRVSTRLHYGPMNEPLWSEVERQADVAFNKVIAARAYLRVWKQVKQAGCAQAARIMSLALRTTGIVRLWPLAGSGTLIVPSDRAFDEIPRHEWDAFLSRGARRHLVRMLLDHVLIGDTDIPDQTVKHFVTASGRATKLTRSGEAYLIDDQVEVTDILVAHGWRILVTDRWRSSMTARAKN